MYSSKDMFTGLVEAVGELLERKPTGGGHRLRVATPLADELSPGDSLAVNGVCLTVIVAKNREIHADVYESVRHALCSSGSEYAGPSRSAIRW